MRCAFVFAFGIICIKLLFDAFMGSFDKEEKTVYALISAFFCGMFFGKLLLTYRQRRAVQHIFYNSLGGFKT